MAMRRVTSLERMPAAGTYDIDGTASTLTFSALGIAGSPTGSFNQLRGVVHLQGIAETSWVEASIDASSLRTTERMLGRFLYSESFLDPAHYPLLRFRSRGVRMTGGDRFGLLGDVTIRDKALPVQLDARFRGARLDRSSTGHLMFSACGALDCSPLLPRGPFASIGRIIGTRVHVELDIDAIARQRTDVGCTRREPRVSLTTNTI
jgi:polyisoprenoid-binding protein YceI